MMCDEVDDGLGGRKRGEGPVLSNFSRPGEYVYEIRMRGSDEGRMTWRVTEPSPDERSVAVHYEVGDDVFDTTVTGGTDEVCDGLAATPVSPFVAVLRFPSLGASADIETLPVGRRIPVPGGERTGSVEVTGRTSRAGKECYRSVWRYDGTIRYEDCLAPDTLLKVSATYYTADDPDPFLRVELVDVT